MGFDGSCCGIYGDHSMSSPESCPPLARCTACYAPGRFGGEGTYLAYFDKREYAFSLLMGKLWTNFAASGNPNVRDTLLDSGHEVVWPMNEAGSLRRNIVLDPRAVPGGSIS